MSVASVLKPKALEMPLNLSNRPRFGKRQIQCLDQIHKDQLIRIWDGDIHSPNLVVGRGPYKENGDWKLDVRSRKNSDFWNRTILLADYSVIRNNSGDWNTVNWLEKI